jgi:hypothetical protein
MGIESVTEEIIYALIESFINRLLAGPIGGRKAETMYLNTGFAQDPMNEIFFHLTPALEVAPNSIFLPKYLRFAWHATIYLMIPGLEIFTTIFDGGQKM